MRTSIALAIAAIISAFVLFAGGNAISGYAHADSPPAPTGFGWDSQPAPSGFGWDDSQPAPGGFGWDSQPAPSGFGWDDSQPPAPPTH